MTSDSQNVDIRVAPGSGLVSRDKLSTALGGNMEDSERTRDVVAKLRRLNAEPPKGSVHRRLQDYRRLTDELIKAHLAQSSLVRMQNDQIDHLQGKSTERQRKRWTDDEDDWLVNHAVEEGTTLLSLAVDLGRTPGAVSSRLTYLVGARRVSRELVGQLTGYLDGEPVEGHFSGTFKPGGN